MYKYGNIVNTERGLDVVTSSDYFGNVSLLMQGNLKENEVFLVEDLMEEESGSSDVLNFLLEVSKDVENLNDSKLLDEMISTSLNMGMNKIHVNKIRSNYWDARECSENLAELMETIDEIPTNFIVLETGQLKHRRTKVNTKNPFFIQNTKALVKVMYKNKLVTIGEAEKVSSSVINEASGELGIEYTWKPRKSFMDKFEIKTDYDMKLFEYFISNPVHFSNSTIHEEFNMVRSLNESIRDWFTKQGSTVTSFNMRSYIRDVKKYHDGKLYIVSYTSNTKLSKVIKFFTRGSYTHSSISLDPEYRTVVTFRMPGKVTGDGMEREHMLTHFDSSINHIVHEIPISKDQLDDILNYFRDIDKSGSNFDFVGSMRTVMIAGSDKHVDGEIYRMFCSQFVDSVLKKSGNDLTGLKSNKVTPKNLEDALASNNIKKTFEGGLYDRFFKVRFDTKLLRRIKKGYKTFRFTFVDPKKEDIAKNPIEIDKEKFYLIPDTM